MNRPRPSMRFGAAPFGRRLAAVRREDGFSLIEVTMATVILAILSVALVGLLQSAIAANGLARQKTVAQQMAQDQVEQIRKLDYTTQIGIVGGNPNGIVAATRSVTVRGLEATMTTEIDWVDDPTPAGYASAANYKKITITVRSNRNNALLTSVVTYVAPPGRAPYGGINNAIINVTVQDMGLATNNLVSGATVNLATGPSAPLSDTTGSSGLVTFPALTANPTSGAQAYYDISAAKSGYLTYVDDRVPGTAAHVQVAPSQTLATTIRLYKAATINVALTQGGSPYAGLTTVKATSGRLGTTQTFTTSGSGSLPITTFAGDPVVPGDFTIRAFTGTGLCADPVSRYVPDNYPTTMSSTYTLPLVSCPSGTLVVNVTQLGMAAAGATVTVKDGPNDYVAIGPTSQSGGTYTFTNLPSGSDAYTINVSRTVSGSTQTVSGSAVVGTGATTTTTLNLPDPPMTSQVVNVRWTTAKSDGTAGTTTTNVSGATVQISGGPYGIPTTSLSTTSSGQVTFSVPSGSGYTIAATKNGQTKTLTSVATGSAQTLDMPTANLAVTVRWAGQPIGSGKTVTVTAGPDGGTYAAQTNASGVATILVPQATSGFPYTASASWNGGTGSTTSITVPSGGQSANIDFTQVGTIRVTTTWAGAASSGAAVSITGGPVSGTFTGTTDATGVALVTVPASATAYTVSASKTGVTVSGSVASVTNGSTNNISLSFTVTFTINVKQGSTNQTTAIVKITGGPVVTTSITVTGNNTAGRGSSGNYTMSNVPIGAGYTIKAYGSPCPSSGFKSKTSTSVTISTGQPTINLVYDNNTCPLP